MLLLSLDDWKNGAGVTLPHQEAAVACMLAHWNDPAPSRTEFEGGFLFLQEGETTPLEEGDYESHRKYLDVQVLMEGKEAVAWANIRDLTPETPYSEEKDRAGYQGKGTTLELLPGTCYVCWPWDGHKACRHLGAPSQFRKMVIKLALPD